MKTIKKIKEQIANVIVGQEKMIDSLLIGLISDGHILLEGLPGLAKTKTIKTLALTLGLDFKRVQFTPDLLPSDIIGAEIYNPKNSDFIVKKGPIFTNLLLADEINRAPAKVQSALLEAMAENQVTIADNSFKLKSPFITLATQNPIEQDGAFNLPQAQLDRFMLKVVVESNTKEQEMQILEFANKNEVKEVKKVATLKDLQKVKKEVEAIHIDEELKAYIVDLIFASRAPSYELKELIEYGASPRASIYLFKAAKAHAYLNGNDFVTPVDIALMAKDVLRHRIILSYDAIAKDLTTDNIIDMILESVPLP